LPLFRIIDSIAVIRIHEEIAKSVLIDDMNNILK